MSNYNFIVKRSPFFGIDQLKNIEKAVLRILEEIGISVLDDKILEQFLGKEEK